MKFSHLYIVIILWASNVFPQKYLVEKFTPENGLPGNNILDVAEDSSGNIWVTSRDGLAYYDVYQWHKLTNPSDYSDKFFTHLDVDDKGNLWVTTQANNFRIFTIVDNQWITLTPPLKGLKGNHQIIDFYIIKKGESYMPFVALRGYGVLTYFKGDWKVLSKKDGLPSLQINSMKKRGNVIYLCHDKGITRIDENLEFYNYSLNDLGLNDREVYSILFDESEDFPKYILASDGIYETENKKARLLKRVKNIQSPMKIVFYSLEQYDKNILLFGTSRINYIFDLRNRKLFPLNEKQGLVESGSYKIFIDSEKTIWISNYYGLSSILSLDFIKFDISSGLPNDDIAAIERYNDSLYILGTVGGFYSLNINDLSVKSHMFKVLENERIVEMTKDLNGEIWITGRQSGIYKVKNLNKLEKVGSDFAFEDVHSLATNHINGILLLSDNDLFELHGSKVDTITNNTELGVDYIRSVYADDNSRVLCTTNGLFISFNGRGWEKFVSNSIRGNNIFTYFNDTKYGKLVGTLDGVYQLVEDSLKKLSIDGTTFDSPTYFISRDNLGEYWFGTSKGVYRITNESIILYNTKNSLLGAEANRDGFYGDDVNYVLIGTNQGLSIFRREFDRAFKPSKARVVINSIFAGSLEVNLDEETKLNYEYNELYINFSLRYTLLPDEFTFYIKLDGIDSDWIKLAEKRRAAMRYSNLAPGSYRFWVKAEDSFGRETEAVSSKPILILPPFYMKTWFLLLTSLFFIGFFFLLLKAYLNSLHKTTLEKELQKRNKQLYKSEEKFRAFFQRNKSVMMIVNVKSMVIKDLNDAASKFYGYNKEELIGKDIQILFSDQNSNIMFDHGGNVKERTVAVHRLANGEERTVEMINSTINISKKNLAFIVIHDITEEVNTRKKLEEAEVKYRSVIENMQDGLFIIVDRKLNYVNHAFAKLVGYEIDEIIGRDFIDFVADDYKELVNDTYIRRIKGEDVPSQYRIKILHKNGSELLINLMASYFKIEDTAYSIGTLKDITEAEKQREALEESEKRYKNIFENNAVGIYRCKPNGKIEIANQAFVEMLGFNSAEEIIDGDITLEELYAGFERETLLMQIEQKGFVKGFETKLIRKDGIEIFVRESARAIKDKEGKTLFYEGVIEDITQSKKYFNELKENEKKLRSVINSIPDPIFEISHLGTIHEIRNDSQISGILDTANLCGRNIMSITKQEYKEKIHEALISVANTDKLKTVMFGIEGDNDEHFFEMRFLKYDSHTLLAIMRDITHWRLYEKRLLNAKEGAELADKIKHQFLLQMSREIKKPLDYIADYLQLLIKSTRSKLTEEESSYLRKMEDGCAILIDTIDSIVMQAELTAGNYSPKFEQFDLTELLKNDFIPEWKEVAKKKKLALEFINESDNNIIEGDKLTIKQTFRNVVNNALIFTKKGSIKIRIYDKEKFLCVDIINSSMGINDDYLSHIFKDFMLEEIERVHNQKGFGLELSLTIRFVELNQAEITVSSTKEEGSKITITFRREIEKK